MFLTEPNNLREKTASVHDVAAYILESSGQMTTMKLQKLVYYCQAWSLVWEERPLFEAQIEAWANGPVVPALYNEHRGIYSIDSWKGGDSKNLTVGDRSSIDAVLEYYGGRSSQWLIDLTHNEDPWRNARKGMGLTERGNNKINHSDIAEYYSSL